MKINEICNLIKGKFITKVIDSKEIKSAYCCDMLSLVMKNAQPDMALITIQTSLNVVAVCVLMESPLIIIAEDSNVDTKTIEKANEENVVIIQTQLSSYEISGLLYSNGVPSVNIK